MLKATQLKSIKIQGYRPFKDFLAKFGPLEVLVGANGSGKSSLFEFLKFLRDSLYQDIPPEIVSGSIGQQIFHSPGPERFWWSVEIDTGLPVTLYYQGELMGPVGRTHISLYNLREYIRGWRFYSSFNIANDKIRKSVPIEQEPLLHEDAGNLSSVLHYLMTEHQDIFDEMQQHLKLAIPGFKGLTVKARGGPGEVIAYWTEEGLGQDLSLADLSDGILRMICWATLCILPNPPSLICIDEPDQGVHPRTLPILAGLFEKACERTQFFLATHASYFLMQFELNRVAVMRKENGEAKFIKPIDSKVLNENLKDFGPEEIEIMHRSDELEKFA